MEEFGTTFVGKGHYVYNEKEKAGQKKKFKCTIEEKKISGY